MCFEGTTARVIKTTTQLL